MQKIVEDLKKQVPFKDTLEPGDIVLIAAKNPPMLVYGLISDIVRDTAKRDEWWQVSIHILSLPPHKVTWVLRTPQMTGLEIFTMDGDERFMKAVEFDGRTRQHRADTHKKSRAASGLRRVK